MWAVLPLRVVLLAATLVDVIGAIDLPPNGAQTAPDYVTGVFEALKLQKPSGADLQEQVKAAIATFDALPEGALLKIAAAKAFSGDGTGLGYLLHCKDVLSGGTLTGPQQAQLFKDLATLVSVSEETSKLTAAQLSTFVGAVASNAPVVCPSLDSAEPAEVKTAFASLVKLLATAAGVGGEMATATKPLAPTTATTAAAGDGSLPDVPDCDSEISPSPPCCAVEADREALYKKGFTDDTAQPTGCRGVCSKKNARCMKKPEGASPSSSTVLSAADSRFRGTEGAHLLLNKARRLGSLQRQSRGGNQVGAMSHTAAFLAATVGGRTCRGSEESDAPAPKGPPLPPTKESYDECLAKGAWPPIPPGATSNTSPIHCTWKLIHSAPMDGTQVELLDPVTNFRVVKQGIAGMALDVGKLPFKANRFGSSGMGGCLGLVLIGTRVTDEVDILVAHASGNIIAVMALVEYFVENHSNNKVYTSQGNNQGKNSVDNFWTEVVNGVKVEKSTGWKRMAQPAGTGLDQIAIWLHGDGRDDGGDSGSTIAVQTLPGVPSGQFYYSKTKEPFTWVLANLSSQGPMETAAQPDWRAALDIQ